MLSLFFSFGIFHLFFLYTQAPLYKWFKRQTGSESCQICSWLCVLFQVVDSQANKEKLQEHPLMSFCADTPNYIYRTWVVTQEGDPEVMEIASLRAFIVVVAGPQSPGMCWELLGIVLKTKMMYMKIIIKEITFFFDCLLCSRLSDLQSFFFIEFSEQFWKVNDIVQFSQKRKFGSGRLSDFPKLPNMWWSQDQGPHLLIVNPKCFPRY